MRRNLWLSVLWFRICSSSQRYLKRLVIIKKTILDSRLIQMRIK